LNHCAGVYVEQDVAKSLLCGSAVCILNG